METAAACLSIKMKMKHRGTWKIIIITAIVLTLAFIWTQSTMSVLESQAESLHVLDLIRPVLELFIGQGNATDHIVRKLAHFIEFAVLGVELMAFIAVLGNTKLQNILNCVFAGLSAAVIDETIQIFSARGSQVQDVLLDLAGCCAGLLLAGLVIWSVRRFNHGKGR